MSQSGGLVHSNVPPEISHDIYLSNLILYDRNGIPKIFSWRIAYNCVRLQWNVGMHVYSYYTLLCEGIFTKYFWQFHYFPMNLKLKLHKDRSFVALSYLQNNTDFQCTLHISTVKEAIRYNIYIKLWASSEAVQPNILSKWGMTSCEIFFL